MNAKAGQLVLTVLVGLLTLPAKASVSPAAAELLDKFRKALDATQSLIESYEEVLDYSYRMPGMSDPMLDGKRFARGQHRVDGRRTYIQNYYWGDLSGRDRDRPESSPGYYLRIETDKRLYYHSTAVNDPRVKGSAYSDPGTREKAVISIGTYSGIFGFLGADERLDAVLRGANRISVRPTTETVNGSACQVIDADTKYGQYTVWLDPAHGYHAAKATRSAVGGQKENQWTMADGDRSTACLDNVHFKQVDGVWVPMEAEQDTAYTSGESFRKNHSHYKRTRVALNPDHERLGSFDDPLLKNPANDPELKNGTRVTIRAPISIKGSWKDGKVVDGSGKVIEYAK